MKDLRDFEERFGTEKQCLDYLYSLRWPDGYRCPRCYHNEAWQIKEWKYKCRKCGYQATVTAGTLFQDSHLPIALWFKAIWYVCSQTGGANALDLQKQLNIGSYRTAWTMLLKIRRLMADNEPVKLGGKVAVDNVGIYKNYRKACSNVFIAAELCSNRTVANICMEKHEDFADFLCTHIRAGSIIISSKSVDFWDDIPKSYKFRKVESIQLAQRQLMPITHDIIQWFDKQGMLDNQQLRSSSKHLQSYLTECCYKFNRRNSTAGEMFDDLLYSAVHTDPLTNKQITTQKQLHQEIICGVTSKFK